MRDDIHGPARLVFEAWTKPELFKQWWIPKSAGLTLLSCDMDIRAGGKYRLEISHGGSSPMAFFGQYIEVTPHSRLVWTNEESGETTVTTVTVEDKGGKTHLAVSELYPSKKALDEALASGMQACTPETFDQLEEFVTLAASAGRSPPPASLGSVKDE